MPCFRGIDVFVGAESESKRLPEFPHPDAASVSLVLRDQQPASPPHGSPSASIHSASDASQTRMSKVNPRASVYIPSLPGIRFWIQYSVNHPPAPPCHLYFKLSANGKPITSWGIDPAKTATGTAAKGLYEPDENWHYQDGSGEVFKQEGIESRLFYFANGPEGGSSTDDGGVIEVQVYRAKGRKRCAPRLVQCQSQDEHDILSPSGGLVERPEDTPFYTWLLLDPKDSPYATFRYYYRSWARLRCLNVLPPLRPARPTGLFPSEPLKDAPGLPAASNGSAQQLELSAAPPTPPGRHDDASCENKAQASRNPNDIRGRIPRVPFPLASPPELWHAMPSSPHNIPQPSKETRDGFSDRGGRPRPLPALPTHPRRAKRAPSPGAPAGAGAPSNASAWGGGGAAGASGSPESSGTQRAVPPAATGLSPGYAPAQPSVSLSPLIPRAKQDASTRVPSPETGSPRPCPSPKLPTSPKQKASPQQQEQQKQQPEHDDTAPEPSTPCQAEWMAPPKGSPVSEPSSPEAGAGRGAALGGLHGTAGFGPHGGIPVLTRGLLGPALTEIPLRGPTGDLMRRLRSEDPFKDD